MRYPSLSAGGPASALILSPPFATRRGIMSVQAFNVLHFHLVSAEKARE